MPLVSDLLTRATQDEGWAAARSQEMSGFGAWEWQNDNTENL